MTLLSIAIPTYNRADLVARLVAKLLALPGDFEICVQDDGSTDDTATRLADLRGSAGGRLRVGSGPNRGRAAALAAAVAMAQGRFIMLFDDDDSLSPSGLAAVLADCATELPAGCAGHIYHLADGDTDKRLGSAFPVGRSNLLALRADHAVEGDKKEVVLATVLRAAMQPAETARRVPTSLYWARIALKHDVICHNLVIGTKTYHPGGMSATIRRLKQENAAPLLRLNRVRLWAFLRGRYRSAAYAFRALAGLGWHGMQALRNRLIRRAGTGR